MAPLVHSRFMLQHFVSASRRLIKKYGINVYFIEYITVHLSYKIKLWFIDDICFAIRAAPLIYSISIRIYEFSCI